MSSKSLATLETPLDTLFVDASYRGYEFTSKVNGHHTDIWNIGEKRVYAFSNTLTYAT